MRTLETNRVYHAETNTRFSMKLVKVVSAVTCVHCGNPFPGAFAIEFDDDDDDDDDDAGTLLCLLCTHDSANMGLIVAL